MKKLLSLAAFAAILAGSFTSCEMKEDDIFDKDPATRQDEWMAEYRRVFNNNDYGWALYISNPTYEHVPNVMAFAVKFSQEYCTFYQSRSTASIPYMSNVDSITSTYSFKMDNGIVLSFDTYNGFFHYYADQSQYFSQDLQSAFEFCLDRFSTNEDTIFGHSKTNLLPMFMVKMKTDAKTYQAQTDAMENYAAYNCSMQIAGDTLRASFLSGYHNLALYYPDEEGGEDVQHLYSYGNLPGALYFMTNITYKGKTIVEMQLNEEEGTYYDPLTKAEIFGTPLADYFFNTDYGDSMYWGYSALGTWTKAEWDAARTEMNAHSSAFPYGLHTIHFEPTGGDMLDLVVNAWYGSHELHYHFNLKKVDKTHIALQNTGHAVTTQSQTCYDSGLKGIIDAIAPTDSWRTYEVGFRSGSPMSPSELTLTDVDNPDNSFYFPTNFRYYYDSIWD